MKTKQFKIGDVVVSVRDVEASNKGLVLGFDERGFVLVRFADGIPRPLPIASLERAADREPRFHPQSADLQEAKSLGDYLIRIESGISQRSNK